MCFKRHGLVLKQEIPRRRFWVEPEELTRSSAPRCRGWQGRGGGDGRDRGDRRDRRDRRLPEPCRAAPCAWSHSQRLLQTRSLRAWVTKPESHLRAAPREPNEPNACFGQGTGSPLAVNLPAGGNRTPGGCGCLPWFVLNVTFCTVSAVSWSFKHH